MKSENFIHMPTLCIPMPLPAGCRAYFVPFARQGDKLSDSLPDSLVLATQIHSDKICEVNESQSSGKNIGEFDAIITGVKNLPIGIMTADCVPVLLYAKDIEMVAAVHAGWRGTVVKITEKTVERLKVHGADVANIYAIFGPAICAECYEVDTTIAKQFIAAGLGEALVPRDDDGKYSLDLLRANRLQLNKAGILDANITESGYCSSHTIISEGLKLPSWRRDGGTELRMCSIIERL